MLFLTRTSVYEVTSPVLGVYKVKKVALLPGQSSGVDAGTTYEGDRVEFNQQGHIVLYKGEMRVLETTHITNL